MSGEGGWCSNPGLPRHRCMGEYFATVVALAAANTCGTVATPTLDGEAGGLPIGRVRAKKSLETNCRLCTFRSGQCRALDARGACDPSPLPHDKASFEISKKSPIAKTRRTPDINRPQQGVDETRHQEASRTGERQRAIPAPWFSARSRSVTVRRGRSGPDGAGPGKSLRVLEYGRYMC